MNFLCVRCLTTKTEHIVPSLMLDTAKMVAAVDVQKGHCLGVVAMTNLKFTYRHGSSCAMHLHRVSMGLMMYTYGSQMNMSLHEYDDQ